MSKSRYLAILLMIAITISSCGTDRSKHGGNSNGNKRITEGLERFVGGSIEELSAFLGEEPVLEEMEYSDEGYPTIVNFEFEKSDISGMLKVDYILVAMTGDSALHIEEIGVWLPYENRPGIVMYDDVSISRVCSRGIRITRFCTS